MICVHACTSSAKGHSMQSLLEKPTSIRSAYLYQTHMYMALCMYTCSCMPTTLSPSPLPPPPPPLAHSNRTPQRMYASVPRCMPIARLGLIHYTMHAFPYSNALRQKPCQCVGAWYVYVRVHASVCACHKGQIESLSLHVSVRIYMYVCTCICASTYAHTIMVDRMLSTSLLIGIHA